MLKYSVDRVRIGIIGGGASGVVLAGFLADAAKAADFPLEIHLFESSDKLLRKVGATGNGRCNFTNENMGPYHYTGGSDTFVESSMANFNFQDACDLFENLGIPWTTLASGMTYPSTMQAATIVDRLHDWLEAGGVHLHFNSEVVDLKQVNSGENQAPTYFLHFSDGQEEAIDMVILASGGGYGIGKDEVSDGYALAKGLGHKLTPMHPGIVALKVEDVDLCQACQGIKVEVAVQQEGKETVHRDDLLFTSYGLSGIAILKVSNDVLYDLRRGKEAAIVVDFLPDHRIEDLVEEVVALGRRFPGWPIEKLFSGYLPKVLVEAISRSGDNMAYHKNETPAPEEMEAFIRMLKAYRFRVKGQKNKDRGQITCGGIDLDLVNPETLESKVADNLYFTGEILDVQGECGGYNLHWAWASAHAVAKAIENKLGRNSSANEEA